MLYTLRFFFSSKCSLFHNANFFGPCIIHILYTGCAKIKKNNSGAKGLKPTGYVMHHQFNIQQLYVLPTLYLCVLYLSENKQRLVPLTA